MSVAGTVRHICREGANWLVFYRLHLFVMVAGLMLSLSCMAEKSLGSLDGYYPMPSGFCNQYKGKKRAACQRTTPQDCLLLKQLSADTIHLETINMQESAMCALNVTAHFENGRILYREMDRENKEWLLELVVTDRLLTFQRPPAPSGANLYCGVHGGWEGIRFQRSKKSQAVQTCFAG